MGNSCSSSRSQGLKKKFSRYLQALLYFVPTVPPVAPVALFGLQSFAQATTHCTHLLRIACTSSNLINLDAKSTSFIIRTDNGCTWPNIIKDTDALAKP
jgi:hypothetical protein